MSAFMSPLHRAERILANRLLDLERRLTHLDKTPAPGDGQGTETYDLYLRTLDRYVRVREMLTAPGQPVTRKDLKRTFGDEAHERGA